MSCLIARPLLPGWHRRESTFRDWYVSLLDRINLDGTHYKQALRVLKCAEQASGYREVRYPKMEKVIAEIERELSGSPTAPQRPVQPPRLLDAIRRPSHVS